MELDELGLIIENVCLCLKIKILYSRGSQPFGTRVHPNQKLLAYPRLRIVGLEHSSTSIIKYNCLRYCT